MISFIGGIESTSAALQAERLRSEIAAQNIANVNTSHGLDGKPYQRQSVVFESVLANQPLSASDGFQAQKVQVAHIDKDKSAPRMVFDPNNPDADDGGMV